METLFGFILLIIFGAVTWCVAAEGAWGAVLHFFCVLFAGLLAMNFFEVVAPMFEGMGSTISPFSDFFGLIGVFTISLFVLRLATEYFAPTQLEIDPRLYDFIRWPWALASGYLTMAIVLTSIHTAPLPREFWGFKPEARNFFDMTAPDREWLGFTQWVSENVLWSGRVFDAPQGKVEGTNQTHWPSFPIRYATKRQDYAGGRKAKTTPPPSGSTPADAGGSSTPGSGF